MKKIITAAIGYLMFASAVFAQQGVKFSGKITNPDGKKLELKADHFSINIPVGKDGTFTMRFDAREAVYELGYGDESTKIYLKNGFDLVMKVDAANFDQTLKFTGTGAAENNVLAANARDLIRLEPKIRATLKTDQMNTIKLLSEYNKTIHHRMTAQGIDPGLEKAYDERISKDVAENKEKRKKAEEARASAVAKYTGQPSPAFEFENFKGGKSRLSDFRGKYVYIDNWATWCTPCKAELPYLTKIEEKYTGKNIVFISISIDKLASRGKWKKFVADNHLGGTQLIADKDFNSDFVTVLGISLIPRFILIGPDGKIIDANAKRPSDPALQAQLDELLQ